jgi:hypothetical protein
MHTGVNTAHRGEYWYLMVGGVALTLTPQKGPHVSTVLIHVVCAIAHVNATVLARDTTLMTKPATIMD